MFKRQRHFVRLSTSSLLLIYTISSSPFSALPSRGWGGEEKGARGCALARTRRFLNIIAVSVEIALTTSMGIIQSGSCSYLGDSLQFAATADIVVLFSIMSTDYV